MTTLPRIICWDHPVYFLHKRGTEYLYGKSYNSTCQFDFKFYRYSGVWIVENSHARGSESLVLEFDCLHLKAVSRFLSLGA